MGWPTYSLRHHFTALLLTLPLISVSTIDATVTELFKATGLLAVLVASVYYLFLYRYEVMLTVGLIFSVLYIAIYLSFLFIGVIYGCSLFQSCGAFEYLFSEPYKAMAKWGPASVFAVLDMALIVAYDIAGVRLGLRESYE